ncbi:hypothetical protein SESBI_23086 [Sesbania bispinosa]|nr:hypothetical protein SESBI_23086 [Sesbania bispinosa]
MSPNLHHCGQPERLRPCSPRRCCTVIPITTLFVLSVAPPPLEALTVTRCRSTTAKIGSSGNDGVGDADRKERIHLL